MRAEETIAVRLETVSHRYGSTMAVDDVSLSVIAGTTTAVVGPDGVGKSTLLALIAGVRRLQAGRLEVLGGDMASGRHRDQVAARIAYMPQGLGRNLYPTLSVVENIDFIGRLFGLDAGERQHRIARLLKATGLDPFPDRPAAKLSGGMKQKLSLCSALIHNPDLLILDEPTTGIDPLSRRQFWTLIEALRCERPGMTVIVATAYMEEAERFERLIAVDRGRILAAEPVAGLLARTGERNLEAAYMMLQAPSRRSSSGPLVMLPRVLRDGAPAIRAAGLTRRFGNFTAVDNVSFTIERGEIFGFLGSNGCGKTTTMKMLTGLLPVTAGRAELLGRPIAAHDIASRLDVGYMSQSFSLYEELSVRANLILHARLYRIDPGVLSVRVDAALVRFELAAVAHQLPSSLPLGIRQRLQLAAACLHKPQILILDEPTSGVDPAARDGFWRTLGELSRNDGVTIFVSTHFMNEAERCDRISLMHAGRVLAVGTPEELKQSKGAARLDDAFISYIEEETGRLQPAQQPTGGQVPVRISVAPITDRQVKSQDKVAIGMSRIWAFARREGIELMRDPVRLAFAFLGPLILLVTFGYGITFDVDRQAFAVLDRDRSIESRRFIEGFASSTYFSQRSPLSNEQEIDHRLTTGELRLALSIPPGFGADLLTGHRPEVGVFLDGANTHRAETVRGYVHGIVIDHAQDVALRAGRPDAAAVPVSLEPRYRYNQSFASVFAILPGSVMLIMALIPPMLASLGIVREREIGSISNLYSSPATVGEYLIGKQLPYIAIGFLSLVMLVLVAILHFGLSIRGSVLALAFAGLLYVFAMTGLGLLVSSFTRTQIAALIATAVISVVPAVSFSGYLYPAATLDGAARVMGHGFPALWFQNVSLGVFAKGLPFGAFAREYLVLFAFGIGFVLAARMVLRKQER